MRRILAFLAAATALAAQSSTAGQTVIRTTTRLVELDVIAHDSHGAPVHLTKDDFSVFDNGKRQTIVFFEESAPAAPSSAPSASAALTNHPPGGRAPVSTIILLDAVNSTASEQAQAKPAVQKFLRTVTPRDQVAIFTLGGGLQLEQDFTGDSARLLAAIDRSRWGSGYQWPAAKQEAEAAALRANAGVNAELGKLVDAVDLAFVSGNPPTDDVKRVRRTCVELVALAKYLGRIPGRKNLLWMGNAFGLRSGTLFFTDEVSQVNHACTDAGVIVDPIDTRGLAFSETQLFHAPLPSGSRQQRSGSAGLVPAIGGAPMAVTGGPTVGPAGLDTMNYVAHYTGGRAFFNGNDITLAMRNAVADSEAAYILGFYADSAALDSTRHVLKVSAARGGIALRYRQGYTATPDDPGSKLAERTQISQALWAPLDAEGIGLTAKTVKIDQPERGLVRVTLSIAGRDVALQSGKGGWTAELALLYDERAADGRDLGRISETLHLQYDESHLRKLGEEGVVYPRLVHPAPSASQIRVVVYDRNSGRLGSLTVPIQ